MTTTEETEIVFDEDGWRVVATGRYYTSFADARKALDHPTVDIPHVLRNLGQGVGDGEGISAYEVLDQIADGLIAMMKPTADSNDAQNAVNGALAVCSIRLRDTAREIGPAPVDTNGGF